MAYEYRCSHGILRLVEVRRRWRLEFEGDQVGSWPSAQTAALAAARHAFDRAAWGPLNAVEIPEDLLDWTPTGDNL